MEETIMTTALTTIDRDAQAGFAALTAAWEACSPSQRLEFEAVVRCELPAFFDEWIAARA
nr:hypothetical protein [Brevundimonas diminuta]